MSCPAPPSAGSQVRSVDVRRQRRAKDDALGSDVHLMPARGELPYETERHEPVAVGAVVGQQH